MLQRPSRSRSVPAGGGPMSWQFYWNLWFRERHVYFVPLPPARCHALLLQGAKSWPVWSHEQIARRAGTGRTDRDDMRLYRATFWGRNGSKPDLRVRIRETPGGSNVEAVVTAEKLNLFVYTVWFGFFGLMTLTSFVSLISYGSWQELYMALFGVAFLAMPLPILATGRWLARRDPERLLDYVRGQLEVTDASTSRPMSEGRNEVRHLRGQVLEAGRIGSATLQVGPAEVAIQSDGHDEIRIPRERAAASWDGEALTIYDGHAIVLQLFRYEPAERVMPILQMLRNPSGPATTGQSVEEHRRLLEQQIDGHLQRGYRVVSQTDTAAQLVRPKSFSFIWAMAWFLLCGVGVLVYVFYYASKSDDTVYLPT